MRDEKEKLEMKVPNAIQLCLADKVLREVFDEDTIAKDTTNWRLVHDKVPN